MEEDVRLILLDTNVISALMQRQADHQVVAWTLSLSHVYKQGGSAGISPDVQILTGHAPRRFADFVAENASAWR